MTFIDVEAEYGAASSTLSFFDLDRTNSAVDTGLDRDNLMVQVESNGVPGPPGSGRGFVTITFPPRPDVTLDPGDSGVVINLVGGRFSSDSFVLRADVFGVTMNFVVDGGMIGFAEDYSFQTRSVAEFAAIQDAVANGFDLLLAPANEVVTAEWASWEHVNITLVATDPVISGAKVDDDRVFWGAR